MYWDYPSSNFVLIFMETLNNCFAQIHLFDSDAINIWRKINCCCLTHFENAMFGDVLDYHHVVFHHVPGTRTKHQHWALRYMWNIC